MKTYEAGQLEKHNIYIYIYIYILDFIQNCVPVSIGSYSYWSPKVSVHRISSSPLIYIYIYIYIWQFTFILAFPNHFIRVFQSPFRRPSGCFWDAAFELPTYRSTYGPTYGVEFHYLRGYLRRSLTKVPNSLKLTPGSPRQESISFTKRSNTKTICFWGDSPNQKFSLGECP